MTLSFAAIWAGRFEAVWDGRFEAVWGAFANARLADESA